MAGQRFQTVGDATTTGSPILVHALSGFLEAGSARQIAVDHLLGTLEHRTIARYPLDDVFDYRARRPRMVFDTDHYASVALPELLVSELTDQGGTTFLLLHGPEPDFGWQRLCEAVLALVRDHEIGLTVGLNAIPWAAPHTRAAGVTAHATSPELLIGRSSGITGAIEVPGHLAGLIEWTLGRAGHPALGFAVHVPHYLVGGAYPRASLTMLTELMGATGLAFRLDSLRAAADAADVELDAQVALNPENVEAIRMLETQYDALTRVQAGTDDDLTADGAPLPSGDEIAAQLEQFLRDLDDRPGD